MMGCFAHRNVDKVGAVDTVLSLCRLMLAQKSMLSQAVSSSPDCSAASGAHQTLHGDIPVSRVVEQSLESSRWNQPGTRMPPNAGNGHCSTGPHPDK